MDIPISGSFSRTDPIVPAHERVALIVNSSILIAVTGVFCALPPALIVSRLFLFCSFRDDVFVAFAPSCAGVRRCPGRGAHACARPGAAVWRSDASGAHRSSCWLTLAGCLYFHGSVRAAHPRPADGSQPRTGSSCGACGESFGLNARCWLHLRACLRAHSGDGTSGGM